MSNKPKKLKYVFNSVQLTNSKKNDTDFESKLVYTILIISQLGRPKLLRRSCQPC